MCKCRIQIRNCSVLMFIILLDSLFSVSSYIESTKSRIKPLLETKGEMSEDDMEKFGRKDPDAYPFLAPFCPTSPMCM